MSKNTKENNSFYGLKSSALSPLEVLSQSIANIAPTASPTVVIPLVFAAAGNATWIAYAFAVIGMLFVSANINVFARRSASPGSIYTYIAEGLGPSWGVAIGWILFVAYVACASSVTTGFTNYFNVLLKDIFGFEGISPAASVGILSLGVLAAWYVAYKDIQLSTRLILGIEFIAVLLTLAIVALTIFNNGFKADIPQFTLEGVSSEGIRLGLVLAMFSFVGFESATALGGEAKNPLKSIPSAVRRSVILVGALFIISSYAEVLGFRGNEIGLDQSDAPLQVLSAKANVPILGKIITAVAIVSFFACVLASITAGARVLFLMARHGVFPKVFAKAHNKNQTPHITTLLAAVLAFLPAAILTGLGNNLFSIYGWIGTTTTLSFIVSYIAVSIAAPIYLKRRGEMKRRNIINSAISVILLGMVLIGTVSPFPTDEYRYFVYAFIVLLAFGLILGAYAGHRAPIKGKITRGVEEIRQRFSDGDGI